MSVEELIDDEIFEQIYSLPDAVSRNKLIMQIRARAKALGCIKDWNALLTAHQEAYINMRRGEKSGVAEFTDPPIEMLKTGDWKADDTGVYRINYDKSPLCNDIKVYACLHPIMPVERLVNADTGREKITLAYAKDRKWRTVTVDRSVCANRSRIIDLSDLGIEVTSENAKELVKYISDCVAYNPDKIPCKKSLSRLGWADDGFAPYSGVQYDGGEDLKPLYAAVKSAGTLEEWKSYVGTLREKSKILRIQMAASFASPLIALSNTSSFIQHTWGGSGAGKTVGMMVAMSVWGDPALGKLTRIMNLTTNNLASSAAFLYAIPFAGDEMQLIKDRWDNYDRFIMYACEGVDRGRNASRTAIEMTKVWRNAFLFTGEEPIIKFSSGGGAVNRVIQIEASETVVANGNAVVNWLSGHHGVAGKPYIEAVQAHREEIPGGVQALTAKILRERSTTEKQAIPAALMALADGIACSVFWPEEKPLTVEDFYPYLTDEKEVDVSLRAYDWTLNWISANSGRFQKRGRDNEPITPQIGEIWGRLDIGYAVINRNVLEKAWSEQGFDYTAVIRQLVQKELVEKDSAGKSTVSVKINGTKARCVKLRLPPEEVTQEEKYLDF